jgi:hypothetical protein
MDCTSDIHAVATSLSRRLLTPSITIHGEGSRARVFVPIKVTTNREIDKARKYFCNNCWKTPVLGNIVLKTARK